MLDKQACSSGFNCVFTVDNNERFKPLEDNRIAVTTANGTEFIQAAMIIRLNAAGADTELFLLNGSKLLVSGSPGEFEPRLFPQGFFDATAPI